MHLQAGTGVKLTKEPGLDGVKIKQSKQTKNWLNCRVSKKPTTKVAGMLQSSRDQLSNPKFSTVVQPHTLPKPTTKVAGIASNTNIDVAIGQIFFRAARGN